MRLSLRSLSTTLSLSSLHRIHNAFAQSASDPTVDAALAASYASYLKLPSLAEDTNASSPASALQQIYKGQRAADEAPEAHRAAHRRTLPVPQHDHTMLLLRNVGNGKCSLFDVLQGKVVTSNCGVCDDDAWSFAEHLVLSGCTSKVMLVWVDDLSSSKVEATSSLVVAVVKALSDSGIEAISFEAGATLPRWAQVKAASEDDSAFQSDLDYFHLMWSSIADAVSRFPRQLATPVETLFGYTIPMCDVLIVHVSSVRILENDAVNLITLDPLGTHETFYRGTLSDVIHKLTQLPKSVALVPTYRSDRSTLLVLRHAMQLAGKQPCIVFPTDLPSGVAGLGARECFSSNLREYWNALRGSMSDNEAIIAVRRGVGCVLRRLQEEVALVSPERVKTLRAEEDVSINSEMGRWLSKVTGHPSRDAAEASFAATQLDRPLFVSWVATDNSAYGRPCNPLAGVNYIRNLHLSDLEGHSWVHPALWEKRGDATLPNLDSYNVLVMHHAKDLLLFMWDDVALTQFLKRGGRVWCVSLAEYLLTAQTILGKKLGLPAIAVRRGISVVRNAGAFDSGYCPMHTPRGELVDHLVFSDSVLRILFADQCKQAVANGQMMSIGHRMEALLAFADMEFRGIRVDYAVAQELEMRRRNEIIELTTALLTYVPRNFPVDAMRQFDWSSVAHLKAYFLGGSIAVGGLVSTLRPTQGWVRNFLLLLHSQQILDAAPPSLLGRYAEVRSGGAGRSTLSSGGHIERVASMFHETPKQHIRVVLFDLESTGLNLDTDEILEVGCWDPVEGVEFSSLVNPMRHIPQETVDIHKITQEIADASPPMSEVSLKLAEFLRLTPQTRRENEILVILAHNAFALDEPLLRRTMATHCSAARMDDVLFCDSLPILKALRRRGASNKIRVPTHIKDALGVSLRLGRLAAALNLQHDGDLHRAINDAKLFWQVLRTVLGVPSDAPQTVGRTAIINAMKVSVQSSPEANCFTASRAPPATVRLPGKIHSSKKLRHLRKLAEEALSSTRTLEPLLEKFAAAGMKEALLIQRKIHLEATAAANLLQCNDEQSALLAEHPDNCIHSLIDMTSTATSRTTSSFPSAHTFPKSGKSDLRRMLVSRFGVDGSMVEIDYAQLEIVVMAALCRDDAMVDNLNRGIDFHILRAAQFGGKTYDELSSGCARGDAACKELRQKAKEFSFQRLYGAGSSLIHRTTKLPMRAIRESIKQEVAAYPGMQRFYRLVRSIALRPNNPGLPSHFLFELPTGARVAFTPKDCVHNLPPLKNYPIQAFGAEITQMMLGRLFRHFHENDFYAQRAFVVNFVHDSVWLDVHNDVADEVIRDTKRLLCSIDSYIPSTFHSVDVPVKFNCTVAVGPSMFDVHSRP